MDENKKTNLCNRAQTYEKNSRYLRSVREMLKTEKSIDQGDSVIDSDKTYAISLPPKAGWGQHGLRMEEEI